MTRSIEKNGGTNGSSSFFTTHCAEFFCPTHGSISSLTHDANPDLCGRFITLFASSRWGGAIPKWESAISASSNSFDRGGPPFQYQEDFDGSKMPGLLLFFQLFEHVNGVRVFGIEL